MQYMGNMQTGEASELRRRVESQIILKPKDSFNS